MASPQNIQPSPDQVSAARVLDFLQFKQPLAVGVPQPGLVKVSDDLLEVPELTKRVFCNSFTGCGGRFRNRRVQQQPAGELHKRLMSLAKRPFCNTYGCYNSGRKRAIQASLETPEVLTGQKFVTSSDGLQWNRIKKLFCNGYGGCQNLGKRLSMLTDDVAKEINNGHSASVPFSKAALGSLGGSKRFFTSSFEDDVDSLRR